MRLQAIATTLEEQLPRLQVKAEMMSDHNLRLTKFRDAIEAAQILGNAGVLTDEVEAILSHEEIVSHIREKVVISASDWNSFNGAINNLRIKGQVLLETLSANMPAPPPDAIDVKLPDTTDMKDVARTILDIDKFLEQALLNDFADADIRLISFDRGSLWLEIALGSQAALSFIAGMLWLIVKLREKNVEIDQKREVVRVIKIHADALEKIEEALEHELNEFREEGLTSLLAAAGLPVEQGEPRERLRNSVKMLAGLLTRGVEVLPSTSAPPEIKNAFPAPPKLISAVAELTSGE